MPDRHFADPGSEAVNHNLSEADKLQGTPKAGHSAGTLVPGAPDHAEPTIFGLISGQVIVSFAMIVLLVIIFAKGGARAITGGLDRSIAGIKQQLDEATALRREAEALRDEYARKIADAETSARDMVGHAEQEAEQIVAQARTDAAELVQRRARMAEDKIAAAERQALAEVRARTATAATQAAGAIIAQRHDPVADKALVDRTIAGLARAN